MTAPAVPEDEFIELFKTLGSPILIAKKLGVSPTNIHKRRARIERDRGIKLETHNGQRPCDYAERRIRHTEGRVDFGILNGSVVVFSDAHFWPGLRTTAHRALLSLLPQIKPAVVVCNGDAFDGASISRFPAMSWMERDKKPSVVEELKACEEYLAEIETAAGSAKLAWTMGNHDARFESRLAASAPEYGHISGFHLKDYFPRWTPCWTVWVNEETLICHRMAGGIHAPWNNLMRGQVNAVTGHLHSLKVTPLTDARGITKYGVDTGTLADPTGPQFSDYMEGKHGNWRSGFAVLTWRDGRLLMPELVQVFDEDTVEFRGHLLNADTGEVL